MTNDTPLSDEQVQHLLQWDEALATGASPSAEQTASASADLRLAKQIQCMKLLRRVRGTSDRKGPPTPGQAAAATPTSHSTTACDATSGSPDSPSLSGLAPQALPARLGKFELIEELGRGGYGVVFLAHDRAMGRDVALKVPHASVLIRDELLMRFRIEARAVAVLDHPHIVPVFDAGNIGPVSYIASAYCPGVSLHDWLREHPLGASPRQAAELVAQLAKAIQHANERGVFHRDLKPANILLQSAAEWPALVGDGDQVARREAVVARALRSSLSELTAKITDFGLAKLAGETLATLSGSVLGTPAYMAPEQASGQTQASTARVDVYSLGAILYQLLSGRVPFEGQSPWETLHRVMHEAPVAIQAIRGGVPRDLETICLKCLEKDPERRYASSGQLAEDLQRFLHDEPILARPVSTMEQVALLCRRKPLASSLVVALMVAVVTGLAAVSYLWTESEARRVQVERALGATAVANDLAIERQRTSDRLLYLNRISLAKRESAVNLSHARQELERCDPRLRDWEWDYLWKICNPEMLEVSGHKQTARVCRFSPDGRLVASGSGTWGVSSPGEVIVREAATAKVLWELTGHPGQITGLAFHPHQPWLVTADNSWSADQPGQINIWDTDTGQLVKTLPSATSSFDVRFDAAGTRLAVAGADGRIRIYGTQRWQVLHILGHHRHSVHSVSFAPSGQWLASAGRDGRMCVFDASTGELVYEQDDLSDARQVAFSPNGDLLACSTFNGHWLVWRTGEWRLLARHFSPSERICSMEFGPDGDCVLVTCLNGATQVLDALTGEIILSMPAHFPGTLSGTFSPLGNLIATCGSDGKLKLWSVATNLEPTQMRVQNSYISDVVTIPGTAWLATGAARNSSHLGLGDGDYALRIVDRTGQQSPRLLTGHTSWTTRLDASPDGQWLVSASWDGSVKLWDVTTGRCLQTMLGHEGPVVGVAFISATQLASAGQDGKLKIWDVPAGECGLELVSEGPPLVCLSADNVHGWIAAADAAGTIRLWNAREPGLGLPCRGLDSTAHCLCFSADGNQLAAGGRDHDIVLWEVPPLDSAARRHGSGELPSKLKCKLPTREIQDIQFLPGGLRLAYASTSFNGSTSVRLLDTVTGEEALDLLDGEETANSLAFDPGRNELILAANSNLVMFDTQLPAMNQRWETHAAEMLRWHARQADLAERQQRAFRLAFHLTQMIEADPASPRLYYRRGNAHAAQRKWSLAEQDFRKMIELTNDSPDGQFCLAMICLAQEDLDGFHSACDELVRRLASSQDANQANTLAWALALTGRRPQDLELMAQRVQFAIDRTRFDNIRHLSYNTQALVHYRAGRYEPALASLRKSLALKNQAAMETDWILLAMIQQALGQHEEARRWLEVARRSIEDAVFLGVPPSKRYSHNWLARYQCRLLYDEAETLIQK